MAQRPIMLALAVLLVILSTGPPARADARKVSFAPAWTHPKTVTWNPDNQGRHLGWYHDRDHRKRGQLEPPRNYSVPEPSEAVLLSAGLLGAFVLVRRRKYQHQ